MAIEKAEVFVTSPGRNFVVFRITTTDGVVGLGDATLNGRELVAAKYLETIAPSLIGKNEDNIEDIWQYLYKGAYWKRGPVTMAAISAVDVALWDIKAKRAGKPLWLLLGEMEPEELVSTLDFRYMTDALTPAEAVEILREGQKGKAERIKHLLEVGYPGYSTAPGWLGYSDEKMVALAKEETQVKGFKQIKLKVGQNIDDDLRRLAKAREAIGPDVRLAVDANQVWDVPTAIDWINKFHDFDLAWVEEPTSPDDVIGHATIARAINPIKVATGEQMQSRILYKQYLQANAFGIMQIDATRVAGPQEIVLEYLLAKKFNKPVCPHAGGVGLCEAVCHFAMFDYVAVSGTMDGRMIEYVDNQHEHFVHPTEIKDGNYVAPTAPGNGTEMTLETAEKYLYRG